jgi:Glycosyl transferase family 1
VGFFMAKKNRNRSIAYFISPHGYGHAARAAAVMEFCHRIDRSLRFVVFTLVPEWFFRGSLEFPFDYHPVLTDIGMVQKTPTVEDPSATLRRLDEFLPFDSDLLDRLARQVSKENCSLVISDISPLGIAVAERAEVPSLLIENFTWDWIYEAYVRYEPGLSRHISYMKEVFRSADHHIQTSPVCSRDTSLLLTQPVSRSLRRPQVEIRRELELPAGARVVALTMGGMPWRFSCLKRLKEDKDLHFIIMGAAERRKRDANLVLLPHRSGLFHPDLINACDAVIGKAGYSTIAEVYQAGVPFGCVERETFPESGVLASFVRNEMNGLVIGAKEFFGDLWVSRIRDLLAMPRLTRSGENGAQQAAEAIRGFLAS